MTDQETSRPQLGFPCCWIGIFSVWVFASASEGYQRDEEGVWREVVMPQSLITFVGVGHRGKDADRFLTEARAALGETQ